MALPLPVGFGFYPTDEELLQFFLERKQRSEAIPGDLIKEATVYDDHPATITKYYKYSNRSSEWFFFTKSTRKGNKSRAPRSAGFGFWKSTQATKNICNSEGHIIGTKQPFAYYEKSNSSNKTDWLMEEFSHGKNNANCWVICKIYLTPSARRTTKLSINQIFVPPQQQFDQNQLYDQGHQAEQNLAVMETGDDSSLNHPIDTDIDSGDCFLQLLED